MYLLKKLKLLLSLGDIIKRFYDSRYLPYVSRHLHPKELMTCVMFVCHVARCTEVSGPYLDILDSAISTP